MPIKESVIKAVFKFVFEIEVGFTSVSEEVKTSLNKFVKSLENQDVFDAWVEKEYVNLKTHSDSLKTVCDKIKTNEKVSNQEFDFMCNVKVFNDILDLNNFKDENRNTKKDVCIVMYNIYKTLQIIRRGKQYSLSEEELDDLYSKCVVKVASPEPIVEKSKQRRPPAQSNQQPQIPQLPLNLGGSLQNLVTDMLGEFQRGELNPMELLQDIMKGPEQINREGSAINNFTKKYEKRLTDDSVKKEIESQLGSIMKNIPNKDNLDLD